MKLPLGTSRQPTQCMTKDFILLQVDDGPLPTALVSYLALVEFLAAVAVEGQVTAFGFARWRFPFQGVGPAGNHLEPAVRYPQPLEFIAVLVTTTAGFSGHH